MAVMSGDNAEEFLRREERGILIHTTPTFEQALHELSQGLHDAVVVQRLVALRLIPTTGLTNLRIVDKPIDGFRQDFCFAVKNGDSDMLALLNEGLSIVIADGPIAISTPGGSPPWNCRDSVASSWAVIISILRSSILTKRENRPVSMSSLPG